MHRKNNIDVKTKHRAKKSMLQETSMFKIYNFLNNAIIYFFNNKVNNKDHNYAHIKAFFIIQTWIIKY